MGAYCQRIQQQEAEIPEAKEMMVEMEDWNGYEKARKQAPSKQGALI